MNGLLYFEEEYTVDSRDVDGQNQARPSALLGYLQETATSAAHSLGVDGFQTVEKYRCIWMLARIWYRLDRPLHHGERLTVRTWHRGGKGASMYRDFDLSVAGEPVGEAVSVWVLADLDTRKLMRFSLMQECGPETAGGELCKSIQLSNLKLPGDLAPAERRMLYYSETDINGHVNNIHYADFTCDALHMETLGEGRFVSELQVSYLAECRPGETLALSTACVGGRWFVSGEDDSGKPRFSAALMLREL